MCALGFAVCLTAGCRAYRPAPIEPSRILAALDAVDPSSLQPDPGEGEPDSGFGADDGLTLREATAVAVTANPALKELRARIGVAAAQLVEAGLLPNPSVGWEASDWLVERTDDAALTGLGLTWELPRPGEIPAKREQAGARLEEARQDVLAAEWQLAVEVAQAWLDVLAARQRLTLNDQLLTIVRRTHDYFRAAREAKAATALQENLSGIELANLENERERLVGAAAEARQRLNALLGLRPEFPIEMRAEEHPFAYEAVRDDPQTILRRALQERPDLEALLALYAQAEAALRLEIKRQWPRIAIGTGIEIELPFFTRFNGPAIQTRMEERQRVRRRVEAAIHDLRREVHAALTALERTDRQIRYLREKLEPRLSESLRLAQEARAVTEITPLELLTSQRQVLEARTRILELYIEHRKGRELVAMLDGTWAPASGESGEENKK